MNFLLVEKRKHLYTFLRASNKGHVKIVAAPNWVKFPLIIFHLERTSRPTRSQTRLSS
jgi:hypothetical protein